MIVTLESAGKRFNNDWIIRNLDLVVSRQSPTVIVGGNGSGKSTLLKIISTNLSLSEGVISFSLNDRNIPVDKVFSHVALASPYLTLYDFYSLREALEFQTSLKPSSINTDEIIELTGLKDSDKLLKYYSSGMLQRVKLTLAMTSSSPLLLLDEPLSNLDKAGVEWYRMMADRFCKNRSTIVFSNHQVEEYYFCNQVLDLSIK